MAEESGDRINYQRRHLRFGWWSLFGFATLGLILETLHAFKVREYLDVSNDTRRLMWTLAHAHGTVFALINVVVASIPLSVAPGCRHQRLVFWCLVGASVLVPGGFFLGGAMPYGGDPGLGILAVPIGAALLLVAVFCLARQAGNEPDEPPGRRPEFGHAESVRPRR